MNGKKVCELDPISYDMIRKMYYDKVFDNDILSVNVDFYKKKYDIILTIRDMKKRISIKMGINNSVHVEGISSFIHFLIECGVGRAVIVEYLKYHYADGTTNGSGVSRMSGDDYKRIFQDKIDYINKNINTFDIINRAINRFVLQGKNSGVQIDGIIYGIKNDFFFMTSSEVREMIMSKINIYSSGVHFASLFCQPMTRCLNHNPKYEKKRFCIQIKWYSLFDDIIEYKNKQIKDRGI